MAVETGNAEAANFKQTVWIMFFAQMISMIGFSSIFPFLPLYVHSLGTVTSLSEELCAGLVYSGQAFTMMIASPIWGTLADRWGRKIMVERAMFGGAAVLTLMAFVRSGEELVALRMLQGAVTGTIGAASALVAATAPRGRIGYAMGLMHAGMGLGLGLGPVIGGTVADTFGYRAAFYITGALLAVAGLVVWVGVKEQFVPNASTKGKQKTFFGHWRRMLSAPGVMLVYSLRFINQMGRIIYMPVLPLFVLSLIENQAFGNSFTGMVLGVSAAAAALFSVYFGRLGDRVGYRLMLVVFFMGASLLFALQALARAGWQLLVLQALYGVAMGGIVPTVSALLAEKTLRGDEGAVYGLDNSITSAARVVGPMLGVSISVWFGIRAVFGATALLYLTAGLIAALALSSSTAGAAGNTQRPPSDPTTRAGG
jgi:DHA1 family multidrug resistance protein-like MFS transporter